MKLHPTFIIYSLCYIVTGDDSNTMLDDIIGFSSEAIDSVMSARVPAGGCRWFGESPFCLDSCPADFDFIRSHSGKCADGTKCAPDASFGEPCLRVFGYQLTKKFCCKSDPVDCTWSGRWMGSHDAFNFYCRFDYSIGRCGQLDCSVNNWRFQAHNTSLIEGENCDELFMWNLRGKASCGYIAWFDDNILKNSWYKTS